MGSVQVHERASQDTTREPNINDDRRHDKAENVGRKFSGWSQENVRRLTSSGGSADICRGSMFSLTCLPICSPPKNPTDLIGEESLTVAWMRVWGLLHGHDRLPKRFLSVVWLAVTYVRYYYEWLM